MLTYDTPAYMFNVNKTNQIGKQEVGIWWVKKRFPQNGVPIWSLWRNIRFLPSIFAEKNEHIWVPKMLPTIWHTYMKLVTKYQIPVINICWEKCDEKCAYMFNVYKNQQSRQTGSRNLMGPKTTSHDMGYRYEDCDQISDLCHQ
jgi:hypothetical protein